jgi:hypothetical protein
MIVVYNYFLGDSRFSVGISERERQIHLSVKRSPFGVGMWAHAQSAKRFA